MKIRERLREYSTHWKLIPVYCSRDVTDILPDAAVLQHSEMNHFKAANHYDPNLLQKWLLKPGGGNELLKGLEGEPWNDEK